MNTKLTRRLFPAMPAAVLAFAAFGCQGDPVARQISAMNDANIKRVTNLYTAYMSMHGWKGPRDEATLKEFIGKYAPDRLEAMKVDAANPGPIFVSERDGKPFKIRYGLGGGPGAAIPVTFEVEGKDGKRQVGLTNGKVEEVDGPQYREMLEGKPAAAETGVMVQPKGTPKEAPKGDSKAK